MSGGDPVILDTNALMMPSQFGLNLVMEVERLQGTFYALIPSGVLDELGRLSDSPGHARTALALARKLLSDGRAVLRDPEGFQGSVDDCIVALAAETGAPVVTNDRGLIGKLELRRLQIIRMKGRNHLECV